MTNHKFYLKGILLFFVVIGVACQQDTGKNKNLETTAQPTKTSLMNPSPRTPSSIKDSMVQKIAMDSTISVEDLMGKINPAKHAAFSLIERKHASRAGMYLRKDAYASFQRMFTAAQKDGVRLIIKSATRPFNSQKTIWEGKWTGKRLVEGGQNLAKTTPDPKQRALKILEYSSMPGTSRHHWGTDIDLNNFTNAYFAKGKGLKEYEWLVAHAADYGFCQPYTAKGVQRPNGYNEEKWHWSYLPVAKKLTEQYQLRLSDADVNGFIGAETAKEIEVVRKYVLGISAACL